MHFRINSHFLHNTTNSLWRLAGWVKELGKICQENMNSYINAVEWKWSWGRQWGKAAFKSSGSSQARGTVFPLSYSLAVATTGYSSLGKDLARQWQCLQMLVLLLPLTPRPDCHCCTPVVLGSRGGERFMSLVICVSLIFQLLLHIWTDCAHVTCPQLSWGVWTNLFFCHHLFLANSPPPHPCALCSKTTQFLFWIYLLLSETQPPFSSGLDSLVLFATFHIYFSCIFFSLAIATSTAMLSLHNLSSLTYKL